MSQFFMNQQCYKKYAEYHFHGTFPYIVVYGYYMGIMGITFDNTNNTKKYIF